MTCILNLHHCFVGVLIFLTVSLFGIFKIRDLIPSVDVPEYENFHFSFYLAVVSLVLSCAASVLLICDYKFAWICYEENYSWMAYWFYDSFCFVILKLYNPPLEKLALKKTAVIWLKLCRYGVKPWTSINIYQWYVDILIFSEHILYNMVI